MAITQNERMARMFADEILGEEVWAWENTMQDYPEGSPEYIEAEAILARPREEIVEDVVNQTMKMLSRNQSVKNLKFVGGDKLAAYVLKQLIESGY